MKTAVRRIIAFSIDYCIIAAFGGILFFVNLELNNTLHYFDWLINHPVRTQAIGFLTLTLPVFSYFVLFERNSWQATPGKRLLNLKVVSAGYDKAPIQCLAIRNGIKFFPWEIAHGSVHWSFYYAGQGFEIPVSLFLLNGAAMLLALIFVVLIFIRKDGRTLYETLSGTTIITVNQISFDDESKSNPRRQPMEQRR